MFSSKLSISQHDKDVAAYLADNGIAYDVWYRGTKTRDGRAQDHFIVGFRAGANRYETDFYQGLGLRQVGGGIDTYCAQCREIKQALPRRITHEEHIAICPDALLRSRVKRPGSFRHVYIPYPTAASALYCLLSDARLGGLNFYDFCDELGMNSDSRKDYALYDACARTACDIRPLFMEHTEKLEELLQDY